MLSSRTLVHLLPSRNAQVFSRSKHFKIGQPHPTTHQHLLKPEEVTPGITSDEYSQRRRTFYNSLVEISKKMFKRDDVVAIIPSAVEQLMSYDIPYTFRQNTSFFYLTGFLEPDSVLVLEKDKSTMFVRAREPHKELWTGIRTGKDGVIKHFGMNEAYHLDDMKNTFSSVLNRNSVVYCMDSNPSITSILAEIKSDIKLYNPTQILSMLRIYKSQSEIKLMRKSAEIAAESMTETMKVTKPGLTEHALAAKMEYECKWRGAQRLSYPVVCGGGQNANILHYITNDDILRDKELVLMDAGCEYHGYSSDITRTWPINGVYSSAQLDIYNIVLNANKQCIEMCQPGMKISLRDIHTKSAEILANGLSQLGFQNPRKYYPHSIGHWLGMDVHDTHDISTTTKLDVGNIVTIEPGLYIPDDDTSAPEKYRGIGIRVEDDILITPNGPEVLTSKVPKDPEEIEYLMKNKK